MDQDVRVKRDPTVVSSARRDHGRHVCVTKTASSSAHHLPDGIAPSNRALRLERDARVR
jgi:hypothetical protein